MGLRIDRSFNGHYKYMWALGGVGGIIPLQDMGKHSLALGILLYTVPTLSDTPASVTGLEGDSHYRTSLKVTKKDIIFPTVH